jgi:ribonuclease Z
VRKSLELTFSILSRPYVVHELLFPDEEASPPDALHPSERQGLDIFADEDGVWKGFASDIGVDVSAGPLLHTGNSNP